MFRKVWFLVSFWNRVPPLISTWLTQASFPELPKQSTPVSYTHLDVYKRQVLAQSSQALMEQLLLK